jgi:hypothetical protein
MKTTFAVLAAAALLAAPLATLAQPKSGGPTALTYRCTSKDGKKYYGSTIPQQCLGQPIEQLNAQGLIVRRIDPAAEEKQREEKAAAALQNREQDAAARENARRDRALLATYTSEKDLEDARARALADNNKAVKDVEQKIEEIKKRRAGYEKELEYYKGKNKPPAQLNENISNTEIDLKAQEGLLDAKRKQADAINAKYDEDKKRYQQLSIGR